MEITRSMIGSQIFVLSPVFGAFDTFVSSWDCGVSGVLGVSEMCIRDRSSDHVLYTILYPFLLFLHPARTTSDILDS